MAIDPLFESAEKLRLAAIFGRSTDAVLFEAAETLDAIAEPSEAERMTLAWILTELEFRHPETDAAMDEWVENDDRELTYTEALKAAVARF